MSRVTAVPYMQALTTFARRFDGQLSIEEVAERFNELWQCGALDFQRADDGSLKVLLAARKAT